MFIEEISEDYFYAVKYDGVKGNKYFWTQEMRKLETQIRYAKDEIEALRALGGNQAAISKYKAKITRYLAEYDKITTATGIDGDAEWKRRMVKFAKSHSGTSGIGDLATRDMANGLRKPPTYILSNEEIARLKDDIKAIRADASIFEFNKGFQTSYVNKYDKIYVRGDVLPDNNSQHPRDLMSSRAVLAHEYYGHRAYRETKLDAGSWNDEFRASYTAAKNAPNLSDEDRRYLILDALERAKENGVAVKNNDFIRKILYGY